VSRHPHNAFDPQVLAVIHRAGARSHVVVARVNGGRPKLMDQRTFSAAEMNRLDGWLDQHRAGQALVVLPASAVVCRTCTLPASDPVQLAQALALQAEAHVGALAPPHRVGAAVLHAAREETTRSGLLIAWPESAGVDLPETTRPIKLTSDVVALAALLNGERPADPLVWLDRESGALAIALTHANGAAFRCAREDAESGEAWQRNVGRALTETGLAVGHTDQFLDSVVRDTQRKIAALNGQPAALVLPPEIVTSAAARLDGARADAAWWQTYGVAAGALLARCDQLQSLTEILDAPPIERPSIVRTMSEALSRPRTAAWCAVAAVLVLLLGPLALHGLRLAVLTMRFDDVQTQLERVEALDDKREMYGALSDMSWPMTKLLADLASNAPEGIELNTIRINYGESVSISGLATPDAGRSGTELIALMQRNLEETRIFSNTTLSWDEPNSFGQYEFSLTSRIAKPYFAFKYPEDRNFADWTMQMRVDGERPSAAAAASDAPAPDDRRDGGETAVAGGGDLEALVSEDPSAPVAGGAAPAASTPGRDRRRTSGADAGDGLASRESERGGGVGGLPPSVDVPEALTEAQIKAMNLNDANTALLRVATARRNARFDAETGERLKREFDMLLAHVAELRKNQ